MTADSQQAVQTPAPGQRHYGLDWLRIGAFSLLILYHIGMYFVTGSWLVKTETPVEWIAYPMIFLTPWRLAILFVVSGYASWALLRKLKELRVFATERSKRLLVPLVAAMVAIIPPQTWVSLHFNHGYTQGFDYFLTHDWLIFGEFHHVTVPGWEHLWFVFYLWLYTMLLVAGLTLVPASLKAELRRRFDALAQGYGLLWIPLIYFVPVRVLITFSTGESHGLFNDWLSDLIYLPCFLFGFGLAGSNTLWPAIGRVWKPALTLVLPSFAVLVAMEWDYPPGQTAPHLPMAMSRAALAVMMWSMSLVMLQLANALLNRDHPWRAKLAEAVFPFYIIHQTAIVLIGWWLLGSGLSVGTEFAIMLAGTVAACWLFYDIGRRIGWLRPLIGLNPAPVSPRPAAASPSPAA